MFSWYNGGVNKALVRATKRRNIRQWNRNWTNLLCSVQWCTRWSVSAKWIDQTLKSIRTIKTRTLVSCCGLY